MKLETGQENVYCQNQAILFNSFNQIITNTITGDIMVLFLIDVLSFRTLDVTFIISLVPLISIIRLPLMFWMRNKNYINLIRFSVIVKILFVTILLFIPFDLLNFYKYVVLVIIYQIAVEFGVGLCWQPLMRMITTDDDRGKFFGKMRFIFMMLNSLYVLGISVFIGDYLTGIQYKLLLLICLLGLIVQVYAIEKIGKVKILFVKNHIKKQKSIKQQFVDNRKVLKILILELLFLCIGVTLNVVYLKNVLMYSSRIITLYIMIFNIASTVVLPVVGSILDRNHKKGLSYICLLYVFYLVVLLCLPIKNGTSFFSSIITIVFAFLSGIISSSVYLLMTVLSHAAISDSEDAFVILNIYQIIVYMATFLVTNLIGRIVTLSEKLKVTFDFLEIDAFKIFNMICVLFCLLVVKLITRNFYDKLAK